MKILFITRSYLPHIGGVERHIEGLVEELGKKHDIDLLTEFHGEEITQTPGINKVISINVSGVPESGKKWVIWKWIWTHRTLLNSYHLIHVHDVVFWLYPVLPFINRKKVFATFHGWEGQWPLPKKNIIKKYLDSKLVSKFLTIGEFVNKWYHLHPSLVSYGAVKKDSSPAVKLPPRTLLFVGRLAEDTGFRKCLQLYQEHRTEKQWHLAVIGDGRLKNLLPPDISYFGPVTHPQAFIKSATWVFVSGYLSVLEALLWDKPIIYAADNPLKRDYFMLHPMSKYLQSRKDEISDKIPPEAGQWAAAQTWAKLAATYEQLWKS